MGIFYPSSSDISLFGSILVFSLWLSITSTIRNLGYVGGKRLNL